MGESDASYRTRLEVEAGKQALLAYRLKMTFKEKVEELNRRFNSPVIKSYKQTSGVVQVDVRAAGGKMISLTDTVEGFPNDVLIAEIMLLI